MLNPQTTLNCAGQLLDLSIPIVMGILNRTPDSFYDGGKYNAIDSALIRVEEMLAEGVDIIDIGGMSSRPGAEIIEVQEEIKRVIPLVKAIKKRYPDTIISIDTVRAEVAESGINEGAGMINDISACSIDSNLINVLAKANVAYVLMHMKGLPESMQDKPQYDDVVAEVLDFLIQKIGWLRENGVDEIVLDVGYGFGKTIDQNYFLLKHLNAFQIPGLPILAGLSRKSMIYKYLKISPKESLNASTALHMIALQNGANILRVHDVKEAKQCIQLWQQINKV